LSEPVNLFLLSILESSILSLLLFEFFGPLLVWQTSPFENLFDFFELPFEPGDLCLVILDFLANPLSTLRVYGTHGIDDVLHLTHPSI
ncbi:MAG: hypothetical protein WDZ75_00950, partial [Candidatus Paceibacterota bacterium]